MVLARCAPHAALILNEETPGLQCHLPDLAPGFKPLVSTLQCTTRVQIKDQNHCRQPPRRAACRAFAYRSFRANYTLSSHCGPISTCRVDRSIPTVDHTLCTIHCTRSSTCRIQIWIPTVDSTSLCN